MLHKVKEIFQKLLSNKDTQQPAEAPYKLEPKIDSLASTTSQPEVKVEAVEQPAKVNKPKKPRTNQNGNKPKQRKNK